MASRRRRKKKNGLLSAFQGGLNHITHLNLGEETKKSITALVFVLLGIVFTLSALGYAGPAGGFAYRVLDYLFGIGYFALPVLLIVAGIFFYFSMEMSLRAVLIGGTILFVSGLGFTDILRSGRGGLLGALGGAIETPFGFSAALLINFFVFLIGVLVTFNIPLRLPQIRREKKKDDSTESNQRTSAGEADDSTESNQRTSAGEADDSTESNQRTSAGEAEENGEILVSGVDEDSHKQDSPDLVPEKEVDDDDEDADEDLSGKNGKAHGKMHIPPVSKNYIPPPLSLLDDASEKPSSGDIKANANIIRRTLASFNIPVEMVEVHVGPTVTRFSLKPAEGVKLSRILSLHNDLSLALAAHPIRIEAPIPGKSLVGVEVPNKSSALVRLRHMMELEAFTKAPPMTMALGKDVSGEAIFANIAKMPHLLIAGSSGSGKSVSIHSLLVGLLYKNSPEHLRLILIDPKRVELSVYEGIPHMATPVITNPKRAVMALKFAISEMDRRYDVLLESKSRDIFSYNKKCREDGGETLPYLLLVIDELADLMGTYPREIESSIVRLAQMARATGIHLVVSTQRPSVETVTGLIKANITSRISLQVASQIDSRTILDSPGAEKLLGGGDLLFISGELSKPRRIQGAFLSEKEIKRVISFICDNNGDEAATIDFDEAEAQKRGDIDLDKFMNDDVDDELYPEAMEVVRSADKASASLLQRRLKIGYARAARLLDIMEERGLIGPPDGAKPREVYIKNSDVPIEDDSEDMEDDSEDKGEDYMSN